MSARTLTRVLAIAIVVIVGLVAAGVSAQVIPGRVAATGVPAQAPLPIGGAGSNNGTTSDLIFGTDTKGPYTLMWKPINRFSEQVTVDGRSVQRDLDYTIDYSAGTITFHNPVSKDSVIRVTYTYDSAIAVQNRSPLSVPLTLDLLKKDNASLQFTGLYKQLDPNAKNSADMMVYGLTGGTKIGDSQFTSQFLFSPERQGVRGGEETSFGDRSAIQLGGTTETDRLTLKTSYLRVGEQFTGARDFKLQQGLEAYDIAATYKATDALSFSSSMKRTDNLAGEKKGQADSVVSHSIAYTPNDSSKLSLSHTEVEKERPGVDTKTTTTDKIELSHTFSPKVSAVAVHESVGTEAGDQESRVTTNQIAISAKPTDNLSVQSSLYQKDSSTDGGETGLGLNVEANPAKTLSVKAAVSRVDTDRAGQDNSESLKVVAAPNARLNVEMSMAHRDADATGEELAHQVKVVSSPIEKVRLEVNAVGRDVSSEQDESAQTMKLSTTAIRNTTLSVDWANKTSDVKGSEQFSGVRVETRPAETVKFSGAFGQKDTADVREFSKEARLEVQPYSHTKVSGGITEIESNGTVVARVTDVSASTKPLSFLQLEGAYKNREKAEQEDLDSLHLSLLLDTGSVFKFTGAYTTNPEDKKGIVQRANSQSFGLRSDLGRIALQGRLTLKDEYLAGRQSELTEIGLDYRFSSNTYLRTSYTLDERKDSSLLQASTYELGFTRKMGSDFHLYLGGRMTTYEQDQALIRDRTEYEAEARLGIKF